MRRPFKLLLWALLGPLAGLLLLALAWVACNGYWADADPQPMPLELRPQAQTLATQDNAFFDSQGLRAPDGISPNDWGQRAWRGDARKDAELLPLPAGEAWLCSSAKDDCVARWRASAADLKAQMASMPLFGERCRALAAAQAFQEPPPLRRDPGPGSEPGMGWVMPQMAPLATCMSWLEIEAVLAPDARQAAQAWGRADALLRLLAAGSQSLIAQAVTWSKVLRHQLLLAQWAARQPAGATLAPAWLAPMPARLLQPRVWMVAELQFQRGTIADLKHRGSQLFSSDPNLWQTWAGRLSLGFLPELTLQALDANWLAYVHAIGDLQGVALAQQARTAFAVEPPLLGLLHWRNPVGRVLLDVARPQFESYPLRQADLVVSQAALALSQQLNEVPARDRAGWWARQPLPAALRARLALEADALVALSWRAEAEPREPARLRFPLRPA
jgi:hypothetical protein